MRSEEGTSRSVVIEDKRCKVGATTHLKAKQNDTNIEREGDHLTDETDLNKKYYVILRTWNVRSLYEEEAVKILEVEAKRYRIDILAIQETHIKETKVTESKEHVLFTSGGKKKI